MRNLKFERHTIGFDINSQSISRNTLHFIPVSLEPLIVKIYDVDDDGNVAEIGTDGWEENKQLILNEIQKVKTTLFGKTSERPIKDHMIGSQYFDTDLNQSIWWNGIKWVKFDGTDA